MTCRYHTEAAHRYLLLSDHYIVYYWEGTCKLLLCVCVPQILVDEDIKAWRGPLDESTCILEHNRTIMLQGKSWKINDQPSRILGIHIWSEFHMSSDKPAKDPHIEFLYLAIFWMLYPLHILPVSLLQVPSISTTQLTIHLETVLVIHNDVLDSLSRSDMLEAMSQDSTVPAFNECTSKQTVPFIFSISPGRFCPAIPKILGHHRSRGTIICSISDASLSPQVKLWTYTTNDHTLQGFARLKKKKT